MALHAGITGHRADAAYDDATSTRAPQAMMDSTRTSNHSSII